MDPNKLQRSTTTDGKAPLPGYEQAGAPSPIDPKTGQHESYYVLAPEERAKGFVMPVRRSYYHAACGCLTTMSQAIAETYAREPGYYGATFCAKCQQHLPVKEFFWADETTGRRLPIQVGAIAPDGVTRSGPLPEPQIESQAMTLASRIGDIVYDQIANMAMEDAFMENRSANADDVMRCAQVLFESAVMKIVNDQLAKGQA